MVVTMKEAAAMDMRIKNKDGLGYPYAACCAVSLYHPTKESISAARKERLRLSAISTSSEQWQTTVTGDSVWLGIEPYAALYTHGERTEFVFYLRTNAFTESLAETFVTDLGLSILRNAHSVQCLRIQVDGTIDMLRFVKTFFSLDAWKEAFPSIRSVYLDRGCDYGWKFDLPPHLLKHVRGLEVYKGSDSPGVVRQIESLIRNKEYGIEEAKFPPCLLMHAELLDDTL